jgi:hypothetical protein
MFGWIGGSGDGILAIEQWVADAWVVRFYDKTCTGAAALSPEVLIARAGVPEPLALEWGHPGEGCSIDSYR